MASNLPTAPTREQIFLEPHNDIDDNTEIVEKQNLKKAKFFKLTQNLI